MTRRHAYKMIRDLAKNSKKHTHKFGFALFRRFCFACCSTEIHRAKVHSQWTNTIKLDTNWTIRARGQILLVVFFWLNIISGSIYKENTSSLASGHSIDNTSETKKREKTDVHISVHTNCQFIMKLLTLFGEGLLISPQVLTTTTFRSNYHRRCQWGDLLLQGRLPHRGTMQRMHSWTGKRTAFAQGTPLVRQVLELALWQRAQECQLSCIWKQSLGEHSPAAGAVRLYQS